MADIIISACLCGKKCRYDGKCSADIRNYFNGHNLIEICPETLGGLGVPRQRAEVSGRQVITDTGEDVTEAFRRGASISANIAKHSEAAIAVMKSKSPSCGKGKIYDGTFSGVMISGDGLTVRALTEAGLEIFDETEIGDALLAAENLQFT